MPPTTLKRILYHDLNGDGEDFQSQVSRVVQDRSVVVDLFLTPEELEEHLRKTRYDLVMIHLGWGRGSGYCQLNAYDLARAVRRHSSQTLLIATSSIGGYLSRLPYADQQVGKHFDDYIDIMRVVSREDIQEFLIECGVIKKGRKKRTT